MHPSQSSVHNPPPASVRTFPNEQFNSIVVMPQCGLATKRAVHGPVRGVDDTHPATTISYYYAARFHRRQQGIPLPDSASRSQHRLTSVDFVQAISMGPAGLDPRRPLSNYFNHAEFGTRCLGEGQLRKPGSTNGSARIVVRIARSRRHACRNRSISCVTSHHCPTWPDSSGRRPWAPRPPRRGAPPGHTA